ncbi:MAG: hypothetical protein VKJ05_07750 [Synechococcaceae cyanobacterium]|nr:hypothetical protein [Synechococcaceae cyanobacterium]
MAPPPPRSRPLHRPSGVLHHLAAVLNLAGRQQPQGETGAPMRRRRQRLALAQRALDPLPPALLPQGRAASLFWRVLRWGGLGMLLAWLLRG